MATVIPLNSGKTAKGASADAVLRRFIQHRLVTVLRVETTDDALWLGRAWLEAGLPILEVTWTVPEAGTVIRELSKAFPHATIGAGTVLDNDIAKQALAAGAQFFVSPVLDSGLLDFGKEQDRLVIPGVTTPNEIHQAMKLGSRLVKIFPISPLGGVEYLKAVRGPLPDVPIVATGGVTLPEVIPMLKAGALAVGVGAPLMPSPDTLKNRDVDALQAHVKTFLASLQNSL